MIHRASEELELSTITRHLIHRPRSADSFLLDARSEQEEHFALAGPMPEGHPLFNDGPEHCHDFQVFVEIARQVGLFVGHRYFRVPAERPCLFYRLDFELAGPGAWRAGDGPARMAMDIRSRPTKVVGEVPRGLHLRSSMAVDGEIGCTGSADLVFLMPNVHRNHRATSRLRMLSAQGDDVDATPTLPPADPFSVGRGDPRNVVVTVPREGTGPVTTTLLVDRTHPVFFMEGTDSVPGILLIEAVRQTAFLAVTRDCGFSARHTALVRGGVHFRGYAELDLPLVCTATTQKPVRTADGRPAAAVRLTISQRHQLVAEAEVTAVLD